MMTRSSEPLWIGPLAEKDQAEALGLLSEEELPEIRQALSHSAPAKQAEDREGWLFWGAYRGSELVGIQLAHLQPGRSAVIWPPRLRRAEGVEVALALLEAVCQELGDRGVGLVYCFLETETGVESKLMQIAGFSRFAYLLYLVAFGEDFPSQCPESPLRFEAYSGQNHERFLRVIEATYVQSLDCPWLNQKRKIEDVVSGYRATGMHRPDLWRLVCAGQEDVGCLLLTDHPELESLELIYMGLIASARGKGWGVEVARYAQWLTRAAGRRQLLLGVDADNWPAIRVYAAVGFRQWGSRMVYGRFLA